MSAAALLVAFGCHGADDAPKPSARGDTATAPDTAEETDADADADTDTDTDTGPDDTGEPWYTRDDDGDGYTHRTGDCDDADPAVHQGAAEVAGDGVDSDCDGLDTDRAVPARDLAAARLYGEASDNPWDEGYGNNAGRYLTFADDMTGDGVSDVIAGGPAEYSGSRARQWLVSGGTRGEVGLAEVAFATWCISSEGCAEGEQPYSQSGFAENFEEVGDLDGDGLADLVIGNGSLGTDGNVVGFSGVPGGVREYQDSLFLVESGGATDFGFGVGGTDADGDGRADFWATLGGEETLFFRPSEGEPTSPEEAEGRVDGYASALAGPPLDLDGDGYEDALFKRRSDDPDAYTFLAGPFVGGGEPEPIFTMDRSDCIPSAGDVDGDGVTDLACRTERNDGAYTEAGQVGFFLGPLRGAREYADADAWLDEGLEGHLGVGRSLSIAGDLDGDGDGEVVVGAPGLDADRASLGAVLVFWDLWSGAATADDADLALVGADLDGSLGWALATDGDFDGDGLDDLVAGAWGETSDEGALLAGNVYMVAGSTLAATRP